MIYELGDRLRSLREKRGLSQTQVAEILGLSRPTIGGYENNSNQPPIDTLVKLAALYGSSVDYIVGLDKVQSISISNLKDDEQESLLEINRLIGTLLEGRRDKREDKNDL